MNRSRDLLVGFTFFGLLILLGALTVFFADFRLGDAARLKIAFRNVDGLEPGADVRIDGYRSGKVDRMERNPGERDILVHIVLYEEPALFEGATFKILESSALGGRVLEIDSNPDDSEARLDLSATHRGSAEGGIFGKVEAIAEKVEALVDDNSDEIHRTLAAVAGFAESLNARDGRGRTMVEDVRGAVTRLTSAIENGEGLVGALLTDADLRDEFLSAVADLSAVTKAVREGEGVLGALVADPGLREDFEGAVAGLSTIVERIAAGQGTLGKLSTDSRLYDTAADVVADLRRVTKERSPDKGIGKFLADDAPWQEFRGAIASVKQVADNVAAATKPVEGQKSVVKLLFADAEMAKRLERSVQSLNDFLETSRENAPLTAFATIILSPF